MSPFIKRLTEHPLPVVFAGFYMYWMANMLMWAKTLGPDIDKAEVVIASVIAGAVGYFKFYVDLIMKDKDNN